MPAFRPSPVSRLFRGSQPDEAGIAMVASLLVMMVVAILVTATLALAVHTIQRSGLDRNRSAALHAAEAGIEADLARLASGTCPTVDDATDTPLPDQNLPTESYRILAPNSALHATLSCTVNGDAVVAATGYVPNMARPVAMVTAVAHVNRGQAAPSSGGTNGGYVFPDAIFTDGGVTATPGSGGTLSTFGLGGTVPSITAGGDVNISDGGTGQLDGPIHAWGNVTLSGSQMGSAVDTSGRTVSLVGQGVTVSGATVFGDVTASGNLNLASGTTVNGNVTYGGTNSSGSPVITGTGPTHASTTLPQVRPMPLFSDNTAEIGTTLGVGSSPATSCPGSGVGAFYDVTVSGTCSYNPATISGTVVVIAHGGTLNVTVPLTSIGQLYVVNDSGNVTITGNNSTMPVFAYAAGTLTMAGGGFSGQVLGHVVTVTANTTLTFVQPATPMPDFSFPGGYSPPASTLFPGTVAFEYQCPGASAC